MTRKQAFRLHLVEYQTITPYEDRDCADIVRACHDMDGERAGLYVDGDDWSAADYATEYVNRFTD